MTTFVLTPGQEPTPEQIARLDAARSRPIVYDEDSPKLTPEELMDLRRVGDGRPPDAAERVGPQEAVRIPVPADR